MDAKCQAAATVSMVVGDGGLQRACDQAPWYLDDLYSVLRNSGAPFSAATDQKSRFRNTCSTI